MLASATRVWQRMATPSLEADVRAGRRTPIGLSLGLERANEGLEVVQGLGEMKGAVGMYAHEVLKFGRPFHMETLQVADPITG